MWIFGKKPAQTQFLWWSSTLGPAAEEAVQSGPGALNIQATATLRYLGQPTNPKPNEFQQVTCCFSSLWISQDFLDPVPDCEDPESW